MKYILLSVLGFLMYAIGVAGVGIILVSVLLIIDSGFTIASIGGIIIGILLMAIVLWLFDIIGVLD